MRRWDADGLVDEEDDVQLDYSGSGDALPQNGEMNGNKKAENLQTVSQETWGKKNK